MADQTVRASRPTTGCSGQRLRPPHAGRLPNACFIGFTGTPLELDDRNTRAVFGDYISIYDIQRAVEDGATVPIDYESRLAKLDLPEEEKPRGIWTP
jgi:type I site-specific restriction-modification system R (restriction) subunit